MRVPSFLLNAGLLVLVVAAGVATSAFWPQRAPAGGAGRGEWTCSMHPQIRQAASGRCPICGMDLIPVEQLSREQAGLAQRTGLEVEPVSYRELFKELRTVGKLDYNER